MSTLRWSARLLTAAGFMAMALCVTQWPIPAVAQSGSEATVVSSGPLQFEERLIRGGYGYAYGTAAADLDGDGDLDLTSTDATNPDVNLLWFENDGQGSLTQHVIYGNDPSYCERHAVADIDGDGDQDIVVVQNKVGHILWFENDGTPADGKPWERHVITTAFWRAYDVAPVDLDGDGDLDVAASGFRGNLFAWFENPGLAAGAEWTQYVIDENIADTRTICAADFNGDGKVDLLGTARLGNLVAWYEHPGDPTQVPWPRHDIDEESLEPGHGHPVDMDGDGDLDVVMAYGMRAEPGQANTHEVAWYENVGEPGVGSEWKRWVIGGLPYGFEAVAGDLDGDGDLDVVGTGALTAGEVSWFENLGDPRGPWRKHFLKSNWAEANTVILMDLDSDGRLDIAATADVPSNELCWWRNLGSHEGHGDVLDIGSRLELFVDDYLIEATNGVTRKLHSPQPRDVAIEFDAPWDGACSHYLTVFQDDGKYRMYYRGLPVRRPLQGLSGAEFWDWILKEGVGHAVTCYAESTDGIHWVKPNLGLFKDEYTGTKNNNIVMVSTEKWPNVTDNFTVFKDTNPNCPPEARYKAVGRHFLGRYHVGNLGFQSGDLRGDRPRLRLPQHRLLGSATAGVRRVPPEVPQGPAGASDERATRRADIHIEGLPPLVRAEVSGVRRGTRGPLEPPARDPVLPRAAHLPRFRRPARGDAGRLPRPSGRGDLRYRLPVVS